VVGVSVLVLVVGAVDGLAAVGLFVGTLDGFAGEVGELEVGMAVMVVLFVCGRGIALMHALLTCSSYAAVQQASLVV
jgi:hypothetical protein